MTVTAQWEIFFRAKSGIWCKNEARRDAGEGYRRGPVKDKEKERQREREREREGRKDQKREVSARMHIIHIPCALEVVYPRFPSQQEEPDNDQRKNGNPGCGGVSRRRVVCHCVACRLVELY